MVAVLLRFCKAPRNDEIALQHFFFFLTAAQEFFSITFVLHAIFFKITHSPHPPAPPQELNGRPLRRERSICLLGVQVPVEGKGWMDLAINNYDYGIFPT